VDPKHAKDALFGVILIGIGVALLAAQMDWSWAPDLRRLWPLFFLFIAAAHISGSRGLLQPMPIYFVCLTAIFLLHTHRVFVLRDSWPLFIVAAGILVLLAQLAHQADRRRRAAGHGKDLR
jgi:hypothetical protein